MPVGALDAMMVIMRYPDGHKEAVKERIVRAASRALRRHGLEGVSIPALMKQAGLTHGAFYTHFKNRDELVAEAVLSAAAETAAGAFSEEFRLEETLNGTYRRATSGTLRTAASWRRSGLMAYDNHLAFGPHSLKWPADSFI